MKKKIFFFLIPLFILIVSGIYFLFPVRNVLETNSIEDNTPVYTEYTINPPQIIAGSYVDWYYFQLNDECIGINEETGAFGFGNTDTRIIGEIIPVPIAKNPNNHQWYICPLDDVNIVDRGNIVNEYGERTMYYSGNGLQTCYQYDNYGNSINTNININNATLMCDNTGKCKISMDIEFTAFTPEDTGFGFLFDPKNETAFRYINYKDYVIDLNNIEKFSLDSYKFALQFNQSDQLETFASWEWHDMLKPIEADNYSLIENHFEVLEIGDFRGILTATYGFGSRQRIQIDPIYTITDDTEFAVYDNVIRENTYAHSKLIDEDIIMYLPFDIDSSTTYVYDWSIYNNNPTIEDSSYYTTGKYGMGMRFDGLDDELDLISGVTQTARASEFTVNFWVYRHGSGSGSRDNFFNSRISGGGDELSRFYVLNPGNQYLIENDFGISMNPEGAADTIEHGSWYMLTLTVNNATQMASLYVNGTNYMNDTEFSMPTGNMNQFYIGHRYDGGEYTNATIDEFTVWNRSLTALEVQQLYNNTFERFKPSTNITFNFTDFKYMGESFPTDGEGLGQPTAITNNETHLFITDSIDNEVYVYFKNGTFSYQFDLGGDGIYGVEGIYYYDNYLYISDDLDNDVNKFTLSGSEISTWSYSAKSTDSDSITGNGTHLFLVDWSDDEIYIYTITGSYVDSIDTSSWSNHIEGICLYNDGFALFDDDNYIYTIDKSGTLISSFYINNYDNSAIKELSCDINTSYMISSSDDVYKNLFNISYDRINITLINTPINNSNISIRVLDSVSYTDQKISDNNTPTEFNTTTIRNNITFQVLFNSPTNFFSSVLLDNFEFSYALSGKIYEDTTKPTVSTAPSNISSNVSIWWDVDFDEAANMTVTYGTCPSYTDIDTVLNTTIAKTLSHNFTGLTNYTEYCFNITSFCDASANCNTTGYNFTFTTLQNIIVSDTCTCPGIGTDHTFDLSDDCFVSTCNADIIDFSGSGNPVTCTGLWNITKLNTNIATWVLNFSSSCIITTRD